MPLTRKPAAGPSVSDASPSDPLKLLDSGNADERWAAARAAVDVVGSASVLGKAVRSEVDQRVREAIFTSLSRIRSIESLNALLPLLRSESANLRTGALDALRAMPEVVRENLPALLADPDSDIRILSCEIARSLSSEDATRILCELLAREQEPNVCAAAIDVLTEVGNAQALPSLKACAQKFEAMPFMAFAVQVATDRILSQSPVQRSPSTPPASPVAHG